MKSILTTITSLLLVFFISSCSKAPQGATGPAGATGATGPGASYYVFYDSIAPTLIPSTGWNATDSINGVINQDYYDHTFSLSYLAVSPQTQEDPIVKVYYSFVSNNDFYTLPATNVYATPDKLDFSFTNGSVTVVYQNTVQQPQQTLYIKIIVIPNP